MRSSAIVALTAQQRPVDFRRHHRNHEGDHRPRPRIVGLTRESTKSALSVPNAVLAGMSEMAA